LGTADIEESEAADGEAGDGDCEERDWRWAIVSLARGGLLELAAPETSKWCPGMMISPTVDHILVYNMDNWLFYLYLQTWYHSPQFVPSHC
jgi:hypothetical protein